MDLTNPGYNWLEQIHAGLRLTKQTRMNCGNKGGYV